jgi:hypothetical protein
MSTEKDFSYYCSANFGCSVEDFQKALERSPGARGAILGAISENLLKGELEAAGYEVRRIKEKPAGGNDAKNTEARGDFYVREEGGGDDRWIVLESKGLKSNSEFRGGKLSTAKQVFTYLKSRAFPSARDREECYEGGLKKYQKHKEAWQKKNPGKSFPPFNWDRRYPGPETCSLSDIWSSEGHLWEYVSSLPTNAFTEDAYRHSRGAIAILETHKPSKRVGEITGIEQAAPLVSDFSVLAVDLFFRTGKHEFAFANANTLSHSPSSPEHLYQNYTIDILVPGLKPAPALIHPWYPSFSDCIKKTKPNRAAIDPTQLDER